MLIFAALVLARITGLFIGAPILSRGGVPRRFRVLLSLWLTGTMVSVVPSAEIPSDAVAVTGAMVGELGFGLAIGLLARLALISFQIAGALVAFQMGFALANSFDPDSQSSTPVIATIHLGLVTLIFLLLDGHHLLIRAVAASFETFPVASGFRFELLAESLSDAASLMYQTGAQVAAPVAGLMLLINAMIGFINRISPQLSIFNIGFPMTVMGGLLVVLAALPNLANYFLISYSLLEQRLIALVGAA